MLVRWRRLLGNPGYYVLGVLMLAVGLGTATALLSVYRGVLMTPLPFPEAARVIDVAWRYQTWRLGFDDAQFRQYAQAQTSFESVAAQTRASYTVAQRDGSQRVSALHVSSDFFHVLRIAPTTGRTFADFDDRVGAELVAVVSAGFARRSFGSDASALDQLLTVDGQRWRVIGVIDAVYADFHGAELYLPLAPVASSIGQGSNYRVIARLRADASLATASAEFAALAERLFVGRTSVPAPALLPMSEAHIESAQAALRLLSVGVALLLLIALANFANLLMLRAGERHAELALRAALGASAGRLLRAIQMESVAIALVGGALGWGMAHALVRALAAMSELPRIDTVTLDAPMFAAAVLLATACGLIASVPAGLHAARRSKASALRNGATGQISAPSRFGAGLVAAQVAMCVVIGVAAVLLLRTVSALSAVDPGFDTKPLLAASWWSTGSRFKDTQGVAAFADDLSQRVEALPGVARAGTMVGGLPLQQGGNFAVRVPGIDELQSVDFRAVSPGALAALDIPLLSGRTFAAADNGSSEPVAIVNAAFARTYFGTSTALDRSVEAAEQSWRIVGVVGDVRSHLTDPSPPTLFLPLAQTPIATLQIFESWFPSQLLVRADGDPAQLIDSVLRTASSADASVPFGQAQTFDSIHAQAMQSQQLYMRLMALFAFAAMLMVVAGIYGLLSRRMAARRRDIGVELALGAARAPLIVGATLRGLAPVAVGIGIGIPAALAMVRYIESLLFVVDGLEVSVYAAVVAMVLFAALAAALSPAIRTARVSPLVALRSGG